MPASGARGHRWKEEGEGRAVGQYERLTLQLRPFGPVATALMRSLPATLLISLWLLNEPDGAAVRLAAE